VEDGGGDERGGYQVLRSPDQIGGEKTSRSNCSSRTLCQGSRPSRRSPYRRLPFLNPQRRPRVSSRSQDKIIRTMSAHDTTGSYRRVGRGGAGNYMSEKELADAQRRTSEVRRPSFCPHSKDADPRMIGSRSAESPHPKPRSLPDHPVGNKYIIIAPDLPLGHIHIVLAEQVFPYGPWRRREHLLSSSVAPEGRIHQAYRCPGSKDHARQHLERPCWSRWSWELSERGRRKEECRNCRLAGASEAGGGPEA
jgi:hypothetical protein